VEVTLSDAGGQTKTHNKAKKVIYCNWFANALSTVHFFVQDTQVKKENTAIINQEMQHRPGTVRTK